eukprot:757847-Hanusia_phi.AAC.6
MSCPIRPRRGPRPGGAPPATVLNASDCPDDPGGGSRIGSRSGIIGPHHPHTHSVPVNQNLSLCFTAEDWWGPYYPIFDYPHPLNYLIVPHHSPHYVPPIFS